MRPIKTEYSFGRCNKPVDEAVDDFIKAHPECKYIPIADHASAHAWPAFIEACEANGKVPVLGVEVPVLTPTATDKGQFKIGEEWELRQCFVKGQSIKPLCGLIETATRQAVQGQPVVTYKQVGGVQSYGPVNPASGAAQDGPPEWQLKDLADAAPLMGALPQPPRTLYDLLEAQDKVPMDELEAELQVIRAKHLEDYFAIVADIVQWARERMLVGPARGSSTSSLVCYALGITTIDPRPHGLLFERFIDRSRDDLPDIDIDVPNNRREEVIEHIKSCYPHTAKLGSVARSSKSGVAMHASTNAAGLVISHVDLAETAPLDHRTGSLQLTKDYAERLGFLKLDVLGVTQLAVINGIVDKIDADHARLHKDFIMHKLKPDDPDVLDVINSRRTAGVYLFGKVTNSLLDRVRINTFQDIADLLALARPGGLGQVDAWVANKQSGKGPDGLIIYQEQVMHLAANMGGLDGNDVRRAISAKDTQALDNMRFQFVQHAMRKHGVARNEAQATWAAMARHGGYSFNKAHAVAYAMVAYWCCWLKHHHYRRFMLASLDHEDDVAKQRALLSEFLKVTGLDFKPIDAKWSRENWCIVQGSYVLAPLTNVKGIGHKQAANIMASRRRGAPLDEATLKKIQTGAVKIGGAIHPTSQSN